MTRPEVPPAPIQAVVITLRVIGGLFLLLLVIEIISYVGEADPGSQRTTQEGQLLILGLLSLWVARLVRKGGRGGLVLGLLVGLFIFCSGVGNGSAPFPFDVLRSEERRVGKECSS